MFCVAKTINYCNAFVISKSLIRRSVTTIGALRCPDKAANAGSAESSQHLKQLPDSEQVVGSKLQNRNPRNLEFLGIAWKRKGWKFQYPSKEFYHRLLFERSHRHTAAYVEHSSGKRVITASTKELAIMRHLYSATDVSAAENIGHILARRCLESGITSMILQEHDNSEKSEKFQAFRDAVVAGGVELSEPEEVQPEYEPGIDYDNAEVVDDLERRQWLVYRLGEKSTTMKALNYQHRLRTRRRPKMRPTPLEAPSWNST
jgi:large subunit ribosomal protein L18